MKIHLVFIFFSLLIISALQAQNAPEKSSPFTAVDWDGDQPVVTYQGTQYAFVSLDGLGAKQILGYCKVEHGKRWKKRFSEDLVEVLEGMGHSTRVKVKLELEKDGKVQAFIAEMTEENRDLVWEHNNAQDEDYKSPVDYGKGNTSDSGKKFKDGPADEVLAQGYKRYDQEYGMIEYKITGDYPGREVIFFDKYGWLEGKESEMKVMGTESKSITYLDGTWIINYTPESNFASKVRNPLFSSFLQNMDENNMSTVVERMMTEGGMGEKVGTENILGKNCTVWEMSSLKSKVWVWKGITLQEETKMLGVNITKEAVKVDFSNRPDKNKLVPTPGTKGID